MSSALLFLLKVVIVCLLVIFLLYPLIKEWRAANTARATKTELPAAKDSDSSSTDRYCHQCGRREKRQEANFCPSCGAALDELKER